MAAQIPDWIVFNGVYRDLYSNPLEQYWTRFGKRRPLFSSTPDCTRGYIATWEIVNNELFLIGLDGNYERRFALIGEKTARYTLKTFLNGKKEKFIKASWFSGKLRLPDGKMTLYQHQSYDSRFEKELIITIHQGDLVKMVTLDYTQKLLILNAEIMMKARQEV